MNYLGHLYLSGTDPLVILGNFIADGVKGRDLSRFPEPVQRGIRLHRAIDSFTNDHPAQRTGRARIRAHAGRYASVVIDIFYDYLLASRWQELREEPLPTFAQRMYALLGERRANMPPDIHQLFQAMRARDWLTSYASLEGIGRALWGLSRRTREGGSMAGAEVVLATHIESYRAEFDDFIRAVTAHTERWRTAEGG